MGRGFQDILLMQGMGFRNIFYAAKIGFEPLLQDSRYT